MRKGLRHILSVHILCWCLKEYNLSKPSMSFPERERERERDSLKEFQERSSSGGSRSGGSTGNRLGRVGGRTRFALEEIENKTLRK